MALVVNRRLWGWSSQEWSMIRDGAAVEIVTPITAIDFGDSANPTVQMASGDLPHGIVDGTYVPGSMTITLLSRYYRDLTRRITNNGEVRLSTVDLQLLIKYSNGPTEDPYVDEISFRMTEPKDSSKAGAGDALVTVCGCMPSMIKRAGVTI